MARVALVVIALLHCCAVCGATGQTVDEWGWHLVSEASCAPALSSLDASNDRCEDDPNGTGVPGQASGSCVGQAGHDAMRAYCRQRCADEPQCFAFSIIQYVVPMAHRPPLICRTSHGTRSPR